MSVWLALLSASLRGQLSYRSSFALEVVGRFMVVGLELVAVFVLFSHIGDLAGWTKWEVVYLYGVASVSLGVAELGTDGLNHMPQLVRMGTLDALFVRPAPVLVQVLGSQCRPLHLGRIAQGGVALCWGLATLRPELGGVEVAMLVVNIGGSAVVFAAIFTMGAATCVYTVQSAEAFNAFTYGGVQMTQFPVPIYPAWLRTLFLWIVPVGFTSYFPALVVLGKEDVLGFPSWLPFAAPLVASLFMALALGYWTLALRRYRSTGS